MSHLANVCGIALLTVSVAEIFGFSNYSGLFGAIVSVGYYASTTKGGAE